MPKLGQTNELTILRTTEIGQILDGGEEFGDILLPLQYVTNDKDDGDIIQVFLYCDSEDRPVATTETPKGYADDIVVLTVKDTNHIGAFLDWGLQKDLLLPFSNQIGRPQIGESLMVKILLDPVSKRLVATQKYQTENSPEFPSYKKGQKVHAVVQEETNLGWKVIADHKHKGMLFHNEIFQPIQEGDILDVYIKEVREDGLIDLKLQGIGYQAQIPKLRNDILEKLHQSPSSSLDLNDKSTPEAIQAQFHCSKKNFKKAIGTLLKEKTISITARGIKLNRNG